MAASETPTISIDDPIEGNYKGLNIVIVKEKHYPAIFKHIDDYFIRDEPMCKSMNDEEFSKGLANFVRTALCQNNGQSLVALDEKTGDVAGFRVSKIITKEMNRKDIEDVAEMTEQGPFQHLLRMVVLDLYKPVENLCDMFNVDNFLDYQGLSVGDKYRQMGLGHELLLRSLRLAKKGGIRVVRGTFSSLYSRRAAEKLGFKVYNEIFFKDYKVNGEVFLKYTDPHPCTCVAIREL